MPSAKILLYKSNKRKDGKHPVVLQITEKGKSFRINLFHCFEKEWNINQFKRSVNNYKVKNNYLRDTLNRVDVIFDSIKKSGKPFTKELFKKMYKGFDKEKTVYAFLGELSSELKTQGKNSSSDIYANLKRVLSNWHPKDFHFTDIDFVFLKKFETYLFNKGCSGGGVNHHMRYLRACYNKAIERDYVSEQYYPFSTQRNKKGYSLSHLKSNAKPRALNDSDLEKLKSFDISKHEKLRATYYYFMFSYYCRGMNFKDMAMIRNIDIYGGRVKYIRSKTKETISVPLHEKCKPIIKYFKNPTNYIFPIGQADDQINKSRRYHNDNLKKIAKLLNIPISLTFYVARHTYANVLKRQGVSVDVISQLLGHEDVETTKAYLNKFDDDILDATDKYL